jgi:hypothetical protein
MATHQHPASKILWAYLSLLDRIYGMYIDACMGFELVGKRLADTAPAQSYSKHISLGEFDDPNQQDATYNHRTTIGNFIGRNQRNGENQLLLSQSSIVFIYSIWDTMFRPQYSEALGKDQSDVKSDVMGDLRHYRHAIVHNNMKLQKPTVRLSFIDVGNAVVLNQNQMRQLFVILFDDLSALNAEQTGEGLNLPFYRPLNPPA